MCNLSILLKNKLIVVVGGGMVGNEIARIATENGASATILRGLTRSSTIDFTSGIDAVIFTAQSRDSHSPIMSDDLFFVNIELVYRCLFAAAHGDVERFCFFSTGSVYAESKSELTETSPLLSTALSSYIASKLAAENIVRSFSPKFKRSTILRPFTVFGPGIAPARLLGRIPRMIQARQPITLAQGKGLVTNPIYSTDAARFALISLFSETGHSTINLGGERAVDLAWIAGIIGDAMGEAPVFKDSPASPLWLVSSVSEMKKSGFVWLHDLEASLRSMAKL